MAIGTSASLTLYEEQFYGGYVEELQQAEGFNGAANGCINLDTAFHRGNFRQESFFDLVDGLIRRRAGTAESVTDKAITTDEFVGVKVLRGIGPVAQTLDAWRKMGSDEREISYAIGQQVGKAQRVEILNSALAAVEGFLDGYDSGALEFDATDGTVATADLIRTLRLAGDSQADVALWVMRSEPWFDLLAEQYGSSNAVFGSDAFGATIYAGMPATLNRPVMVTDSPSLVAAGEVSSAADAYSIIGLKRGAIQVDFSEPERMVLDLVTGHDSLVYRLQGENAYTLNLRGCKWDTSAGANPTDEDLADGTHWLKVVSDDKLLPGVMCKAASQ